MIDSFLKIVDKIPNLENHLQWLVNEIKDLESRKMQAREELEAFNTKIAKSKEELFDVEKVFKQKYGEYEAIINQKQFLEHLVNKFKREDEDFIEIEYVAEEKVGELLTNNRKLLEFALVSVVEALRKDVDRYLLIDKMPLTTTATIHGQGAFPPPAQPYHYDNTDIAREKVLEAADRLFNKLAKGLASDAIYTTANYFSNSTSSSSPLPLASNSSSSLILPEQIDFYNRKQNSQIHIKALEVGVLPADDIGDEDPDIEEIQENHKSDFADL